MIENNLENMASVVLEEVYNLFQLDKYEDAKYQAQTVIDNCKNILKDRDTNQDELNNKALIISIMFRGIQDFVDLSKNTKIPNWMKQPIIVEKVWRQMLDCKERIEFASNFCENKNALDWIINAIEYLNKIFLNKFGPGKYLSPEFLIEEVECSICKKDHRSCNHISGKIYNGILCHFFIKNFEGKGVAIVDDPKDLRCRIWPWNVTGNDTRATFEAIVATIFRLDDF